MLVMKKSIFAFVLIFILQGCSSSRLSYEEYLNVIKAYPDYEYEAPIDLPKFTYANVSDTNFVKIRNVFGLDSIAGNGDEVSRILNLMKWVHNSIKHDGSKKNPLPISTFNIVEVCKSENRGVNCRGLAVMLNEVYLSMGFKSRYIACLPVERLFDDCHVINTVYSNKLNKWIYIDPTYSAYLTDENGEMLSIQEVRDRIVTGKNIIVNDDINWNGQPYDSSKYLAYMSKNLFRLVSPVEGEYDYESKSNRKFVELIPKGYDTSMNIFSSILSKLKSAFSKMEYYYTSNPNYFWER